jgi:ribosomal-protein-alanine N-acetyltransferase
MFQTHRLYIRLLAETDLSNMHQLNSIPEVDEYNTLGLPKSIEDTQNLLANCLTKQNAIPQESYFFCLELVNTHEFIGLMGLNLGRATYKSGEVWYKIHPTHWRQGYTTEALERILNFAFKDLQLHRVEAGCATANIASVRVLEKVGMTREGQTRKKLPIRGQWVDNYEYAILEEDYLKLPDKTQ